jgi:small-conductance mechanosensitive channel
MPDFGAPWTATVASILLIVVLTLVAVRAARPLVHGVITAVFDREAAKGRVTDETAIEIAKRRDTIERLGARVIQGFVIVVAALTILAKLDYNIGPAVAGFGVVGIAVGFGAQSLVKDYFNGALILLENQYSIGDVVSIAGVTGTVEDLTLRRTTLRDVDGVVHTVPNGEIRVASNRTRGNGGPPAPPPSPRPAVTTPRRGGG